ncbi:unnamed protein product [Prorocentrum cordatum]|uniref:Uncharacterized protein n=1 Tax=Prorocentrum cordatum TaxID=2364126 RepID=A0ABN9Y3G2_9DINO|nr:unnamed protein product [Polarella glacialis]
MVPPTGLGSSAVPLRMPPGLQPTQAVPQGDGQGAAVGSRFETAVRDFIDSEVMLNFDHMSVDAMGDGATASGSPPWVALCRDLRLLGYDLNLDDGWDRLGLCKEGPAPDKALVLRRAGLLGDLLNSVADGPLTEPERAMKRSWISRATEAHQQCLSELQEVLRVRQLQRVAEDRLPRWAEAEPVVVEHSVHEAGIPCTCLLNLSRILRARPQTADAHVSPSPEGARVACGQLLQGGGAFLQAMATMAGCGIMLWRLGRRKTSAACAVAWLRPPCRESLSTHSSSCRSIRALAAIRLGSWGARGHMTSSRLRAGGPPSYIPYRSATSP